MPTPTPRIEIMSDADESRRTALPTAPYRGTRDFLPEEMSLRTQVFQRLYRVLEGHGYQRYDGPLLEPMEIYEAKSGEEIGGRQLFHLVDHGGRRLAIRPEMTPSLARIVAGNLHSLVLPIRWYSHINCHRYERPQKGRLREHWQINVDVMGADGPYAEAEIFRIVHELLQSLGGTLRDYVVKVNDRELMQLALGRFVQVPDESIRAVCRVLDGWAKVPASVSHEALNKLGVDAAGIERIEQLLHVQFSDLSEVVPAEQLAKSRLVRVLKEQLVGFPLEFDMGIIRGFDYYTSTVFEVFDSDPQNRRSLFGGGRYDSLTALFGGESVPAIGFGMGDVTVFDFLAAHQLTPAPDCAPHAVCLPIAPSERAYVEAIAARLRAVGLRAVLPLDDAKLKNELKRAVRRGARVALIAGEDERTRGVVSLRDLAASETKEVALDEVAAVVARLVAK
jgi:histidyl-tRNA synthetase